MAEVMSEEEIRINLPEPIYELINFVPKFIRDKNAKALGASIVMGQREAAEKRMQNMISAMTELHISKDDELILENLVDSINMLRYRVSFIKKPRPYKPYSSNNETRSASKPIPAEEVCQSVEFSGLRLENEISREFVDNEEGEDEDMNMNPLGYEPKYKDEELER